jgi:hypothetical protein
MGYHSILGQVAEAFWMCPDTTITVEVYYFEESCKPRLVHVIENHRNAYPLKELEALNCDLMNYDCHGYEPLGHNISTVDMYPNSNPSKAFSIEEFLALLTAEKTL